MWTPIASSACRKHAIDLAIFIHAFSSTQILCSAVRGIGLPRKGHTLRTMAISQWESRTPHGRQGSPHVVALARSACCGPMMLTASQQLRSAYRRTQQRFEFRGSKRYDVQPATMDVRPVLDLINLRIDRNGLRNLRLASRGERALERPAEESGRNRTKSACWSEEALRWIRSCRMLDCDSGRWHGRVGHWPASKRNAHSFSALPLAALVTSPYTPGAPLARWRLLQAVRLRILRRAASRQRP